MNEISEKDIKKLLKGTECVLISTDNGVGIEGNGVRVLSAFNMLVIQLRQNFSDKVIKEVFENSFLSEKEIFEKVLKSLEKIKDKLGEDNE